MFSPDARIPGPDLLVAFDVDPEPYYQSNGYNISEQGKPPDFVLEVASASTAERDFGVRRDDYAAFGIAEYWRFDETGEHYGARLVGERLVEGEYRPMRIKRLSQDLLQGHSEVLGLAIRWHDPGTSRPIASFDDERARAEAAEVRVRELEEELRRLRGE